MKRILVILIFIVCLISFSSCNFKIDGDGQIARKNILKLLDNIEKGSKEQIIELFSPIKKEKIDNLPNQVDDLCNYYSGTHTSISSTGLGAYETVDYGKKVKYFEMFYDVHTSESDYHFSSLWYIYDDFDPENIGIWSLVVEKYEGDISQTPIGEWSDGITLI